MKRQPTIGNRGRARDSVHVVQVFLGVGVLHVCVVALAAHAAVESDGGIVACVAVDCDGALVVIVGGGIVAQGVGVALHVTLQARLFVGALVLDTTQRGLLVGCSRADAERRWVAGLVGVVLGGRRRLVLEIERIWHGQSVQVSRRAHAGVPALTMCGRVMLAHVLRARLRVRGRVFRASRCRQARCGAVAAMRRSGSVEREAVKGRAGGA